MAFCGHCGTQTQDDVKFCPACGQPTGATDVQSAVAAPPQTAPTEYRQAPTTPQYQPPVMPGAPTQDDIQDAQNGKTMAVLAYILFFIPLLTGAHKTSRFVRYHTNQGTVLFLVAVAYSIVSAILSSIITVEAVVWGINTGVRVTPGWLSVILMLLGIPIAILAIIGIINALNGRMKPLPLIGKITIIK